MFSTLKILWEITGVTKWQPWLYVSPKDFFEDIIPYMNNIMQLNSMAESLLSVNIIWKFVPKFTDVYYDS